MEKQLELGRQERQHLGMLAMCKSERFRAIGAVGRQWQWQKPKQGQQGRIPGNIYIIFNSIVVQFIKVYKLQIWFCVATYELVHGDDEG